MDGDAIRQWLAALDSISYYELFRIEQSATHDALRDAFHAFAESFHPDSHNWRHPTEQAAIGYIFRRGTEAYRVLSDQQLRFRYDEALANGILRPENLIVETDGPRSQSMAPPGAAGGLGNRLIDKVRTPGARPFVLRVEELAKKGDPQQAKLQLVMAMHMDRGNPALEAYAKELDEAIKAKAEEAKKSWKK
ncbi:MAG TPA: DnaJ domain-containing protein [Labilithrix sp.]|nr:DnaJ domain-containing protein [Labilithrix sp.]